MLVKLDLLETLSAKNNLVYISEIKNMAYTMFINL